MLDIFLQICGGLGYLFHKIFLFLAEGCESARKLRITAWTADIIGLVAWTIILFQEQNWIMIGVGFGGLPSMVLGLVLAFGVRGNTVGWIEKISRIFFWSFPFMGLIYSVCFYFGDILIFFCEIGTMIGFLVGTRLLARQKSSGWLLFVLMNASTGTLMLLQDKNLLVFQQGISFCLAIAGFYRSRKSISRNI